MGDVWVGISVFEPGRDFATLSRFLMECRTKINRPRHQVAKKYQMSRVSNRCASWQQIQLWVVTVPASLDRMDRLNWHLQLPDTMFLTAQYRASRLKRPDRSLKMTILSLESYLCYEENISARGRHYNTIRQGAPFYHYLSGRRHFHTTTRSIWMLVYFHWA